MRPATFLPIFLMDPIYGHGCSCVRYLSEDESARIEKQKWEKNCSIHWNVLRFESSGLVLA